MEKTPKQIGKYRIDGILGKGGMSVVYRASAEGPGGFEKSFAVKVLTRDRAKQDETVTMFVDEARLGAQLVHPNIVPVLDFGETDGGYFLAMEYVAGASLAELMKRRFKRGAGFSADEVLYVAGEVLKALDYAHNFHDREGRKRPVIHRDVTPENVLISGVGAVKLCDFGIAKGDFRTEKTKTGIVKGKVAYIAPEVMRTGRASVRSDLYSLGVILFEMVAGKRLAPSRLDQAKVDELDCDEGLKALIRKAVDTEPEQRFKSASEMLNAVLELRFDPLIAARGLGKGLVRRKRSKKQVTGSAVSGEERKQELRVPETGRDRWFTIILLLVLLALLFTTSILLAVFKVNLLK